LDLPIITIGNKNAKNTITFVTNPLCTPCAEMHFRIETMLNENKNLKCQILFISGTSKNDLGGLFVRKLFSLPEYLHEKALNLWFTKNNKNFDKWNQEFKNFPDGLENVIKQKQLLEWANRSNIKSTPFIFFNNKSINETIKIEDLMYILSIESN
jgi:protein-disulfide isomerase